MKVNFTEKEISNDTEFENEYDRIGLNSVPLLVFSDRLVIGYYEQEILSALEENSLEFLPN